MGFLDLVRFGGQFHVGAVGSGLGGVASAAAAFFLFAVLARVLVIFLHVGCVPGFVVVGVEGLAQGFQFLQGQLAVEQVAVDRFCGEVLDAAGDLRAGCCLACFACAADHAQVQPGDGVLHHDVAGCVPEGRIHAFAGEGVKEHAVHHGVQVIARQCRGFFRIGAGRPGGAVAQVVAVGCEGGSCDGQSFQAGAGACHEAHVHHDGVFGKLKRLGP